MLRVIHVLPHPGGGGETYVDYLTTMEGYAFERLYIAPDPRPRPSAFLGAIRAQARGRRFDLVHVHGEVGAGLCLPSLKLRPSVVTINGLHLVRRLDGWKRLVAEANLRLIVRAASTTICVGEAELADVRAVVGDSSRLVLVKNGVDPQRPYTPDERRAARAELGIASEDFVGVCLAALDRHKEPLVAAQAALATAEGGVPAVLLFAGDGPLRSDLDALASRSRAIQVLGFRRDRSRIFAAADFFVLPSRREGLSFALLEAMSSGLPPVVSDAPGNEDAVGEAGIVVPSGNAAAFASAFRRLALNGRERYELSERARTQAARFSGREMVERTRDVYAHVLNCLR